MCPQQDETLEYYAGYTEEEIDPVVVLMVDYLARPVIHEAFFKKYASKKFLKGMCCHAPGLIPNTAHTNSSCSIHLDPPVGKEECGCIRH